MNKVKTIYTHPKIHDIKPNGGNHSHPGNKRYIDIIKKKKLDYVLADAKGKTKIITDVYNALIPGRFLQKEKDGKFSIRDKKSSLGRIRKSLGENNAKIVEFFQYRGELPWTDSRKRKSTSMKGSREKQEQKKCTIDRPRESPNKLSKIPNKKLQSNSTPKITSDDWKLLAESLMRKGK